MGGLLRGGCHTSSHAESYADDDDGNGFRSTEESPSAAHKKRDQQQSAIVHPSGRCETLVQDVDVVVSCLDRRHPV